MLGNRYNPNDDESLQKELEQGLSRMLMIRFDIEHLSLFQDNNADVVD